MADPQIRSEEEVPEAEVSGISADEALVEPGAEADAAEAEAPVDPRDAAVVEAERQRDEYLDALQRERAAFENFRRRATKERMDALDRGGEQLVASLLGVLDNLGFALDASQQTEDNQLAKGVQMVAGELTGVLTQAGLEVVAAVGVPFDPAVHDALLSVDAAEAGVEVADDPVVVEILRTGYRFKGRTLRPASVKVAR